MMGIALKEPKGSCDGSNPLVKGGPKLFSCKPGHGIFVSPNEVRVPAYSPSPCSSYISLSTCLPPIAVHVFIIHLTTYPFHSRAPAVLLQSVTLLPQSATIFCVRAAEECSLAQLRMPHMTTCHPTRAPTDPGNRYCTRSL